MVNNEILDEFTYSISVNKTIVIEYRIKILLQSKPRYLPEWLWKRLIPKFIRIEENLD